MTSVNSRLASLGIELPAISANGTYACATLHDAWIFTAGFVSRTDAGVLTRSAGCVDDIDLLRLAARICVLRAIAAIAQVTELDAVSRVLRLTGFIAASEDFRDHSRVMDAASETIEAVFGVPCGRHSRTAVGVSSLPGGGAVELHLDAFSGKPASPLILR